MMRKFDVEIEHSHGIRYYPKVEAESKDKAIDLIIDQWDARGKVDEIISADATEVWDGSTV